MIVYVMNDISDNLYYDAKILYIPRGTYLFIYFFIFKYFIEKLLW